jgi:creatinine amidohydrolase
MKDCPVLPSYVHANVGETSCILAVRPDLVNMAAAINEKDYETFFEYRMDQYSKSGIVGRETTKSTAEFGEKIFGMVVNNLVSMVQDAIREEIPESRRRRASMTRR